MKVKRSQVGWGFWLQWVLVSTVGWFVGLLIAFIWDMLVVGGAIGSGVLGGILACSMLGAALGSVVGLMQWLVLRAQVSRSGWWVLASTAGFAVAVGGAYGAAFVAFGYSPPAMGWGVPRSWAGSWSGPWVGL
jgi:hypothetical protein